jgi:hypothetical protein
MEPRDTLQHFPEYLLEYCHLGKLKHQSSSMNTFPYLFDINFVPVSG